MPGRSSHLDHDSGDVDRHIGARLYGRRIMLRMSAEAIAIRSRLELSAYLDYEAGHSRIPAGALFEVCQILKVPVRFVFDCYGPEQDSAKLWARHPNVPPGLEG